jgi:DNA polymerase III subunit gamma/tau
MSKRYQVLARKYRPQAFRDVVGQEAAVTTLKNAIRFDKIAHAYLFCGSRGVGKTTLARLFAKALNCHALSPEFEPCNECPSCLEIVSGQSLDVIEIDGASNRGIDDIRQINETVGYAPSQGRYKIYIIDEVHMLTKEAFNALLKTLEEPPEQAKFFFATTEPHKVLPTIISRCQRFDLARIQPQQISSKLEQIAADLQRTVQPEALQLIASFSEGSLRDAESLFDQILCFSEATITASIVRQILGLVQEELFHSLDQAFSACHLPYAFELVDQLFQTGKDLAHFLEQLIEHYRNIVNAKCKQAESAKLYTMQQALHILDLLIQAESTFQKSAFQRISLESLLLQIIRSRHRIPIEVLIKHISSGNIEQEQKPVPPAAPKVEVVETPKPVQTAAPELKAVPFNPYASKNEGAKPVVIEEKKLMPQASAPIEEKKGPKKPQSHYDTVMRFAAVEFEGTIKN